MSLYSSPTDSSGDEDDEVMLPAAEAGAKQQYTFVDKSVLEYYR